MKGRVRELSMMATSLKHEAFHKNLECPICLSFFKEPKILTCSHTFCKGCLETLLESRGNLLCPTCREETSVPAGDVVGDHRSDPLPDTGGRTSAQLTLESTATAFNTGEPAQGIDWGLPHSPPDFPKHSLGDLNPTGDRGLLTLAPL
eukprot:XP_011666208.1 PREDICTED: E3 ubiquitin-protein ligase RNF152-like [Strongylocentrotus purpuratus]